ncbi:MAG: hypothetical protein IJ849_01800 [Selenomonadaceae bacterium]|nr:hypothetical protein [Selenomonadaceae bacterium]
MDRETPTYAGLILSLRKYRDRLMEERNVKLNAKPREIDVRIIDQLSDTAERMDNAIAYMFERHNIIELKNPTEPLNIDVMWKGISYAAQYKSMGYDKFTKAQGINAIPMKDITLTFLRMSKPTALFNELTQSGYKLKSKFPGVYYVYGVADIKMQIVVGKELEGDEFVPLRLQKTNPTWDDAGKFVQLSRNTKNLRDRELIDSILHLSIMENRELYEKLRKEEPEMCEALRELMRHEIQEDLDEQYRAGSNDTLDTVARNMIGLGFDDDTIMAVTSLSSDAIARERGSM